MGWVVNASPCPFYPPVKTRYPWYRRLGEPQSLSGRVRKISIPSGFDPRTVHSIRSHYTDWAVAAHAVANFLTWCCHQWNSERPQPLLNIWHTILAVRRVYVLSCTNFPVDCVYSFCLFKIAVSGWPYTASDGRMIRESALVWKNIQGNSMALISGGNVLLRAHNEKNCKY